MARKSRKHQLTRTTTPTEPAVVGYVRLSVLNKEESYSIENQKFIIELWGDRHQTPISHYYVDNGFSGSSFERPAFKELVQDICDGKVGCVVVKDDCVNIELKSEGLENAGLCDVSSVF